MKVWLIWMQETTGYAWLEAAWTDDMTAENHPGWCDEVDRCKKLAFEENYEMRIQEVVIPGVPELFEIPKATAEKAF